MLQGQDIRDKKMMHIDLLKLEKDMLLTWNKMFNIQSLTPKSKDRLILRMKELRDSSNQQGLMKKLLKNKIFLTVQFKTAKYNQI